MRKRKSIHWLLLTGCLALPAARVSAEGLSDWQSRDEPRLRIAASPYPNYLLHILPSGFDLKRHRYRVGISSFGFQPSAETGRGHFYTRRGGFLDLAHVRRAIDFAGYVHFHTRKALIEGRDGFSFESIDQTTYRVSLRYPAFWQTLGEAERERLAGELATRAAVEAAFDFSNWREILTWYDFHNLPGMPERGSAFSYEDVPSHAVGIAVAERALRAEGVPFDEAVTRELRREIDDLGVVPQETYQRAMELVGYRWWGKKTCLKRHIDTGRDDGFIDPWLVRGLASGPEPRPKRYPAPSRRYADVLGRDCRGMVVLECEPHLRDDEVRQRIPAKVRPSRDYPALLSRIEKEIRLEFGPNATVPYP